MSGVHEAFLKFCKEFEINPNGQLAEEDGYFFREGYAAGLRAKPASRPLHKASRLLTINAAAANLVREALDNLDHVHPCDQNDDEAKAKLLSPLMKALYEALHQ